MTTLDMQVKLEALAGEVRRLMSMSASVLAIEEDVEELTAQLDEIERRGGEKPLHVPISGEGGFPFGEVFSFGIAIEGALVRVFPGTVQASGLVFTSGETEITITGTGQYIGVALDRDAGTLSVTGPHTSRPVSSGDTWRSALYVFRLSNGVATLVSCKLTDIRLEVAL